MVIGADWVTSHWGEMELKICPDGQNKGFGWKSGKQWEEARRRVVEEEKQPGRRRGLKKEKHNEEWDNGREIREFY